MSEEELKLKNGEQPIAKISDTELVILISRDFANNSTLVTKKLNKIQSDSKSGKNRISASVLKIANRDLNKIDLLIEKANEDFRDIICEAEYPRVYKYGFDEPNEEQLKEDYLNDWKEYLEWKNNIK
jgi:hypothetical protein